MSQYLNITPYSFIYLALVIVFFFFTVRNRLDILSVSMVCYVVYSMYCFFGYGISGHYRPKLSPMLYGLVFMQMILLWRYVAHARKEDAQKYLAALRKTDRECPGAVAEDDRVTTAFCLYTAVMLLFTLINIIPLGLSGFSAGKANVWDNTNVLYVVSLYGAYPSFAYGLHTGKKRIWIPAVLIEMTIFFAGARAFLATMIVMFLCERGVILWRKTQNNTGVFVLGAAAIGFLLVYRMVDTAIMNGNILDALRILAQPETWLEAFEFNEPRVIIANYDYSITSGIRLPFGDIVYRIADMVPGLAGLLPIELQYPDYYSDWLFAEVQASAGVGGSIWGESYAMLGVVGVVVFTALWIVWLRFANNHLDYHRPFSAFIVALGTYHAWYINRLDFNRVGQSVKVMLLCFLIWACFYLVLGGELLIGKKIRIKLYDPLLHIIRIVWSKTGAPVAAFVRKLWAPVGAAVARISDKCGPAVKGAANALIEKVYAPVAGFFSRGWKKLSVPTRKFFSRQSEKLQPAATRFRQHVSEPCNRFLERALAAAKKACEPLAHLWARVCRTCFTPIGRWIGKAWSVVDRKLFALCCKVEAKLTNEKSE